MEIIDDKATEEVMNCLLSMSKMPTSQPEIKYWQNYQDGEPSIIWKFSNDNAVQVPYEYKLEKFVIAESVVQDSNLKNNTNQIVLIQNVPNSSTQYEELTGNNFDPTFTNISQEDTLNVLELESSSLKTESSYSESIDVEVEDSDTKDIIVCSEPAPSTNKTTQVKKGVAIKRKKKFKKKGVNIKENKTNSKKVVKTKERDKFKNGNEEEKGDNSKYNELTRLEDNAGQVAARFQKGCECMTNCFDEFNAEKVFRHRLNIADLTKAEHDMYIMGVIHASMQNPDATSRKKERIRIRTTYAYYGKRVCLTAFLYLNHVTLYQMKIIRKHLQNHGVSPRIHGNHGRKPSNTLPFDIYKHATNFVQSFIEKHHIKNVNDSSKSKCKNIYKLPAEFTKKTLHEEYRRYFQESMPSAKAMQYSTFTNFFKKQFPNVKFRKTEKRFDEVHETADEKFRKNKKRGKINVVPSADVPTDVASEVEVVDNSDYNSFVILQTF